MIELATKEDLERKPSWANYFRIDESGLKFWFERKPSLKYYDETKERGWSTASGTESSENNKVLCLGISKVDKRILEMHLLSYGNE